MSQSYDVIQIQTRGNIMYEALLLIPVEAELNGIEDMLDIYEGAIPPALAFTFVEEEPSDLVAPEGT